MNDIVLNKKESIERCVRQIRLYYLAPAETAFEEDYLKQDAIAINLQRACEQAIDLANYTIKKKKLGLPKESKESFRLLADSIFSRVRTFITTPYNPILLCEVALRYVARARGNFLPLRV